MIEGDVSATGVEAVLVSLTTDPLNVQDIVDSVRSPKAGATVLFAGTNKPAAFQPHRC